MSFDGKFRRFMNQQLYSKYKGNILVVDDNLDNISLLTKILSKQGYKVRVATNGRLAVQSVNANPPDLLLLDIKIPIIDGYEVCKQLKAVERTANIPIIFISALDETNDKISAFEVGGADYITKPVEPIEVLARIENQLRLRRFQLELQIQNDQLQLLLSTTQAVGSALDVEEALAIIVKNICETLGWNMGEAWMPNSELNVLEYCRGWHIQDERLDKFCEQSQKLTFGLGDGLVGRIWLSQQLELVEDISQDCYTSFKRQKIAMTAGIKGVMGIPIIFNQQVLAILVFFHNQAMILDERSRQLVTAVASQVGGMIQRKKAEEALRFSEARFAGMLAIAQDAIIAVDSNQKITLFNQGAEKLFGYTSGEIIGQSLDKLLPMRFVNIHCQHIHKFADSPQPTKQMGERREVFACRKDGSEVPVEASISKLELGKEKIFTAILRDVTERKQSEKFLRQQAKIEKLITKVSQQIRQSLDLQVVLSTTVKRIRDCLMADRVAIYKMESDDDGVFVAESVHEGYSPLLNQKIPSTYIKKFYNQYNRGVTTVINEIQKSQLTTEIFEFLQLFQVKALIIVPILNNNCLWGLLAAHQCGFSRHWKSFEVNLLQQLANQVAIAIHQSQLYQQVQTANQELERLANLDGLTQIANRRRFDEHIHCEWMRLRRDKSPISLILFDVDFFKMYNDTYGHQAGDDCLQQIADAVKNLVRRAGDLVARYGGEEFAVILSRTDSQGAIYIAKTIQNTVHRLAIPHSKSKVSNYVTVSLGAATMIPNLNLLPENLINAADTALYIAKQQGRDRFFIDL
ncbi:diguanylate cyclase with PAS/PAC and GAF sensors [Richelia sinica FACHB-800]|uniref:Diguanylate cyclase with PAS/PAC and GAF sensors n=2 Tax=Richelia TaxID=98443 RepID=A0A975TD79_9NOST|nr:diguanylate cyclase with PAS/PAC and GAF sensors [Richelia sinica FACHB-800]